MRINVSGPALADWDPDSAIDHWWREGQRRLHERALKKFSSQSQDSHNSSDGVEFSIEDWEAWVRTVDKH